LLIVGEMTACSPSPWIKKRKRSGVFQLVQAAAPEAAAQPHQPKRKADV
jgi:hypothetical protein